MNGKIHKNERRSQQQGGRRKLREQEKAKRGAPRKFRDQMAEFRRLCAENAHDHPDALFRQLPETLQRTPRLSLLMAKSLTSRALHGEAGLILSNALLANEGHKKLCLRYILNLAHSGNIAEASSLLPALGEELDAVATLALARAFVEKGEWALAAVVLEKCPDRATHPSLERIYARLQSRQSGANRQSLSSLHESREKVTASLYAGDLQGAREELEKYISRQENALSIDEMCRISSEFIRVGDAEKALELFKAIISRLSQQENGALKGSSIRDLSYVSSQLEEEIPEPVVKKIIDGGVHDLKAAQTNDLMALVGLCQRANDPVNVRAILAELLGRELKQTHLPAALMAATLLGDADMMRRFADKFKNSADAEDAAPAFDEKSGILALDRLGISGYRADSDKAVLIFNSLAPSNLWGIVGILLKKNVSPIFVHDMQRCLHLTGLGSRPASTESSAAELRRELDELGITKIYTLGFSAGGLGALLYAEALGAAGCMVFSPPTHVPPCGDPDEVRGQIMRRRIERLGLLDASDVAKRFSASKAPPEAHVYYPAHSKIDALHAERLRALDNVKLFPQEETEHGFCTKWDNQRWREAIGALLAQA